MSGATFARLPGLLEFVGGVEGSTELDESRIGENRSNVVRFLLNGLEKAGDFESGMTAVGVR